MKELEEVNHFFGYTNEPDRENPVKIFDYKSPSPKALEMLNGYKKFSDEGLEFCVKNTDKLKDIKYHVNAPESLIKRKIPYYPGKIGFLIF